MKILIDPFIFNAQKFGGISRYFVEISKGLLKKKDISVSCPLVYSENFYLKENTLFLNSWRSLIFPFLKGIVGKKIKNMFYRQNHKVLMKALSDRKFDLFIPTYYNIDFLNHIGDIPFVLTVHDMIHELFPQYFKSDTTTVANKKRLIERASKIIAISENTKNDILKIYPFIEASKIEVVYHGISIDTKSVKSIFGIPSKYILFVGNRDNYKRFDFFIKSIAELLKKENDLFVMCAGGNGFNEDESKLLNSLEVFDKVIQNNFEDDELSSYYTNALCFVFPSEYEGFGFPVLESMACACPVVLPNSSSFPEVAGDAGVYFNSDDAVDLKRKVEMIIYDSKARNEYSLKGLQQVKKFTWDNCVEHTYKVYKSALIK